MDQRASSQQQSDSAEDGMDEAKSQYNLRNRHRDRNPHFFRGLAFDSMCLSSQNGAVRAIGAASLVVGGLGLLCNVLEDKAAMKQKSARGSADKSNRPHHGDQTRDPQAQTPCVCGASMSVGHINQRAAKCSNCNKSVHYLKNSGRTAACFYCPKGSNARHCNGFFYCGPCAAQVRRFGNQAMPVPTPSRYRVVKSGWMSKRGECFNFNTGYKKRWFKLWNNKRMAYLDGPSASHTKGYADFTHFEKMEKKGKHGFEVSTKERVWCFLCADTQDRDDWFDTIQNVCLGASQYAPVTMASSSATSVNEEQPGMVGDNNVCDGHDSQQNNAALEPGASNMENDSAAAPAAYSYDASAPFEEHVVPSAPFEEEEGVVTAQ